MATGLFVCGNIEPGQSELVRGILQTLVDIIDDDIVIFDNYKSNKLEKVTGVNYDDLERCKIVKIYLDGFENWSQVKDFYRQILLNNDVKTLIFTKAVMMGGFMNNDNKAFLYFRDQLRQGNDKVNWTFNSIKAIIAKFYFIVAASRICDNVYHYVTDPQEFNFGILKFKNYRRLCYINTSNGHNKYIPLYDNYLAKLGPTLLRAKCKDFVFYCTAVSKNRADIAQQKEMLEMFEGWDVKIIAPKLKGKKEQTLSQLEYYKKLAESRYTTVIKSYDEKTFSSIRFVEAVALECLPFVMADVNLVDCEATYPEIYQIIKEYLIVKDFLDIKDKIVQIPESTRLELLDKICNTVDWKKLSSEKFLRRCWGSLEGVETL